MALRTLEYEPGFSDAMRFIVALFNSLGYKTLLPSWHELLILGIIGTYVKNTSYIDRYSKGQL